jgi:hypothetical protein
MNAPFKVIWGTSLFMKGLAGPARRIFLTAMGCLCAIVCVSMAARPVFAACESCACVSAAHASIRAEVQVQHQRTRTYIAQQMQIHRDNWIIPWLFQQHVLPAMMMMTEQLTAASAHQMLIVGTYFDAKEQMERMRDFEKMRAMAYKTYTPSVGFCEIGTMMRSLAEAQRNSEVNALVMSQRQQQRQRNMIAQASADGKSGDINARIEQFAHRFCDIRESNNGLSPVCKQSSNEATRDKDVDYARDIDNPSNIRVDFTANGAPAAGGANGGNEFGDNESDNEQDIMSLSNNLFGHDPFRFLSGSLFDTKDGNSGGENQLTYLDIRGILAKRSVAENSFNAIIGMKSKANGAGNDAEAKNTANYMKVIYKELGVDNQNDLNALMTDQPSYYAQMEMLTKKLYERPQFYTNLYDKPVNNDRKEVALRAIGLMQNMDMFKSQLRAEATISVILETALADEQTDLQNRIRKIKPTGAERVKP